MTAALAERTDAPSAPDDARSALPHQPSPAGPHTRPHAVADGNSPGEATATRPALPGTATVTAIARATPAAGAPVAPLAAVSAPTVPETVAAAQAIPAASGPRLEPVPECEPPLDAEPWDRPAAGASFGTQPLWRDRPAAPDRAMPEAARRAAPGEVPAANPEDHPTAPPMTHRRWSQIRRPLTRRTASPSPVGGPAMPRAVSPAARGTAPEPAGARAVMPGGPRSRRPQPRGARPIYSASGVIVEPEDDYPDLLPIEIVAPGHQRPAARPPALDTATLLARALVEILAGRRPASQLRPHCTDGVYDALDDFPRLGPGPSLVSMWVCEPTQGRAEVSASFRCGGMTRALAMRLDDADHRWQITALQLA